MSTLGRRIRAAREGLGRNRNQMARDLGTSWQHVDRWERDRTAPSPESLRKLAAYLGVTIDHLLGTEEAPGPAAGPGPAGDGFELFTASYAPPDISDAELSWLRAAPVDHAALTPGDYINMLHGLRQSAGQGEGTTRAPRAKSGRQRKIRWEDVQARTEKAGGEGSS